MLLCPYGVYRPQADTILLAETLRSLPLTSRRDDGAGGGHVLDIGTGTGALAVAAARAGADRVTAVDVSLRAVLAARFNTMLRGLPVRVYHGDVFQRIAGYQFDVIVANPPYVPADQDGPAARGRARAWDAGADGRALLDPICTSGPGFLAPGGVLLLVHSAVSGVETSLAQLRAAGMTASVVARRNERFGPVMSSRRRLLRERGLIDSAQHHEELVVIRADAAVTVGRTRSGCGRTTRPATSRPGA